VTTPAERVRKIWAGSKPFPSKGLAATTGAFAAPAGDAGPRTTTVLGAPECSHPAAEATASTSAPPTTAAIKASAEAERERTAAHCSRAHRALWIWLEHRGWAFSRGKTQPFEGRPGPRRSDETGLELALGNIGAEDQREERPAILRVELDPAAHHLRELAGDREAETAA
jgi:hypothetical protein